MDAMTFSVLSMLKQQSELLKTANMNIDMNFVLADGKKQKSRKIVFKFKKTKDGDRFEIAFNKAASNVADMISNGLPGTIGEILHITREERRVGPVIIIQMPNDMKMPSLEDIDNMPTPVSLVSPSDCLLCQSGMHQPIDRN